MPSKNSLPHDIDDKQLVELAAQYSEVMKVFSVLSRERAAFLSYLIANNNNNHLADEIYLNLIKVFEDLENPPPATKGNRSQLDAYLGKLNTKMNRLDIEVRKYGQALTIKQDMVD